MTSRWRGNCHLDGKKWNVVCVIVFWLSIFLDSANIVGATKSPGTAIKEALFVNRTYDITERPVENYNDPIHVIIDISLSQIVNVHEKDQYIHIQIWIRLSWNDSHINWKPAEYGGVTSIYVPVAEIWTPDIVIVNEIGLESGFVRTNFLARVYSNGLVTWHYPKVIQTACKMNVSRFPFDKQECPIMFSSWVYDGHLLVLENKTAHAERDQYRDHGEWQLTHLPAKQNIIKTYKCCIGTPFYDVTYTIGILRRSLYYTYTLVFPCICLTFLCLTGFLLPVQSGERISMNLMILLAQVVLLLVVFDNMPAQSEVIPIIGVYIGACIILITFSTVLNILVLYIYFRGTRGRRMPQWMRKYLLHGGAFLLGYRSMLAAEKSAHEGQQKERKLSTALRSSTMLTPSLSSIPRPGSISSSPMPVSAPGQSASRRVPHTTVTPAFEAHHQHGNQHGSQDSVIHRGNMRFEDIPPGEFLASRTDSLDYESRFLKAKLRNSKFAEGEIFNEWKVFSFVLDRFFFIAYFIITFVLTLYILI